MFSASKAQEAAIELTPKEGGTVAYLVKWELPTPEPGKSGRLDLTLEHRPEGGGKREIGNTIIWNPEGETTKSDGTPLSQEEKDKKIQNFVDSICHIVSTFRPDLPFSQIQQTPSDGTFAGFVTAMLNLLPEGYKEMEATWKLFYPGGRDRLTLPSWPSFVRLGKGKFKFNPDFEKMVVTQGRTSNGRPKAPTEEPEFHQPAAAETQDDLPF